MSQIQLSPQDLATLLQLINKQVDQRDIVNGFQQGDLVGAKEVFDAMVRCKVLTDMPAKSRICTTTKKLSQDFVYGLMTKQKQLKETYVNVQFQSQMTENSVDAFLHAEHKQSGQKVLLKVIHCLGQTGVKFATMARKHASSAQLEGYRVLNKYQTVGNKIFRYHDWEIMCRTEPIFIIIELPQPAINLSGLLKSKTEEEMKGIVRKLVHDILPIIYTFHAHNLTLLSCSADTIYHYPTLGFMPLDLIMWKDVNTVKPLDYLEGTEIPFKSVCQCIVDYLSPDAMLSKLNLSYLFNPYKLDVYNFGAIILEIISQKCQSQMKEFHQQRSVIYEKGDLANPQTEKQFRDLSAKFFMVNEAAIAYDLLLHAFPSNLLYAPLTGEMFTIQNILKDHILADVGRDRWNTLELCDMIESDVFFRFTRHAHSLFNRYEPSYYEMCHLQPHELVTTNKELQLMIEKHSAVSQVIKFPNGIIYTGDYHRNINQYYGRGQYRDATSLLYEGEVGGEGQLHGSGRLYLAGGSLSYQGTFSSNRCVGGELSYVKNDKIYPSKPLTITKEPIAQLKDLQFVEKHSLVHQLFWVGPRSIKLQRNKRLGYSLLHRNVKGIQGETVIPPSNRYQFSASLKQQDELYFISSLRLTECVLNNHLLKILVHQKHHIRSIRISGEFSNQTPFINYNEELASVIQQMILLETLIIEDNTTLVKYLSDVRHLKEIQLLKGCSLKSPQKLLHSCVNLEKIVLHQPIESTIKQKFMQKIRQIDFSHQSISLDVLVGLKNLKYLNSLTLSNIKGYFESTEEVDFPSLIAKLPLHLLNLSGTDLTSRGLASLFTKSDILGHGLQELILRNCRQVTHDATFKEVFSHMSCLKILDLNLDALSSCGKQQYTNNHIFSSFARHTLCERPRDVTQEKKLHLNGRIALTKLALRLDRDSVLLDLHQVVDMGSLQHLELSGLSLTDTIVQILVDANPPNLECLILKGELLSLSTLQSITQSSLNTKLRQLHLIWLVDGGGNLQQVLTAMIAKSWLLLEKLTLNVECKELPVCLELPSKHFQQLVKVTTNLNLKLGINPKLRKIVLQNHSLQTLLQVSEWTINDIQNPEAKQEDTYDYLVFQTQQPYWPKLSELVIGGGWSGDQQKYNQSHQLSHRDIIHLLSIQYEGLKILDLSYQVLTKDTLDTINSSIKKTLRLLNLKGCLSLSSSQLAQFFKMSKFPQINTILLDHTNTDDDVLTQLAQNSQTVTKLYVSHCELIRGSGIEAFINSRQYTIDTLQISYNEVMKNFATKLDLKKSQIKHMHAENVKNLNIESLVEMKNSRIDFLELKMDQSAYQFLIDYLSSHQTIELKQFHIQPSAFIQNDLQVRQALALHQNQ